MKWQRSLWNAELTQPTLVISFLWNALECIVRLYKACIPQIVFSYIVSASEFVASKQESNKQQE